jgi:hypothetical protein
MALMGHERERLPVTKSAAVKAPVPFKREFLIDDALDEIAPDRRAAECRRW